MAILNIREANRHGASLLIGLAGVSGGGKTHTALRLAYGLANGNSNKIGLLDTENRRGSLYADKLPNKERFLIGDLIPPFSPKRYVEAIIEFQKSEIEVLIVDSISHEWEGEGGCQDIAENNKLAGLPNWALAKAEHKRFINTLLYCDMHVIVCLRAREKARPVKDENGKTVFVSDGLTAITEKNALFEMTASLMVTDQGMTQTVIKCPADLIPFLGRGSGYLTEDDGRAIRSWVDGADPEDDVTRTIHQLEIITEQGLEALRTAWEATPQAIQKAIGKTGIDTLKAAAEEYERLRESPSVEVK